MSVLTSRNHILPVLQQLALRHVWEISPPLIQKNQTLKTYRVYLTYLAEYIKFGITVKFAPHTKEM
jgi:hypothetical protein